MGYYYFQMVHQRDKPINHNDPVTNHVKFSTSLINIRSVQSVIASTTTTTTTTMLSITASSSAGKQPIIPSINTLQNILQKLTGTTFTRYRLQCAPMHNLLSNAILSRVHFAFRSPAVGVYRYKTIFLYPKHYHHRLKTQNSFRHCE